MKRNQKSKSLFYLFKIIRIEKEKLSYKIKEQKDCTFAPELNQLDVEIFNYDVKSDENVRRYVERLDKAKKMKEEINTRFNPDYSKEYNLLVTQMRDTKS